MGRITEMFAYLNSSTKDWKSGSIKLDDFKSFNINNDAKLYRRWYKYGKESTFEEYLNNLKLDKLSKIKTVEELKEYVKLYPPKNNEVIELKRTKYLEELADRDFRVGDTFFVDGIGTFKFID